jgi:hypothetical protein
LKIFQNFAIDREDHLSLLSISDFGDDLLDLLSYKNDEVNIHALVLLRALIKQRESKAHFLWNENTFKSLSLLLNTLDTKKISLITSFLWVLVYDCEKAKVEFRKYQMDQIFQNLELRIANLQDDKSTYAECKRNINNVLSILL